LESQALSYIRRVLLADVRGEGDHALLCLLNFDAGLQSAELREIVGAAIGFPFGCERKRLPDIDGSPKDRMFESRRHHADYLDRFSVELNSFSHDVWVASETPRPKTIAEDDDVVSARL